MSSAEMICVDKEFYVESEFANLALDLKLSSDLPPTRAQLKQLLEDWRKKDQTVSQEIDEMFSEFSRGQGKQYINWRD